MRVGDHRINIAAIEMSFLITIALVGIVPLCLYIIALLYPPAASAMGKHPNGVPRRITKRFDAAASTDASLIS